MIPANELRIGNHVDVIGGKPSVVTGITSEKVKDGILYFVYLDDGKHYLQEHLIPIPLNPEIFLSFGFIEGAMLDNSFINDELSFDLIKGHYYLRNGDIYNYSKPIDFLHQLQNISIDLTGQELEFKQQPAIIHSRS